MTLYQKITEPNNLDLIVKLIRRKIIPTPTIIRDINLFEDYHKMDADTKQSRYSELADKYKLHNKTVQNIILKLSKEI